MTALDEPNRLEPVRGWHGPRTANSLLTALRNVTAAGATDQERVRWFRTTRAYRDMPEYLRREWDARMENPA